MPHCGCFLSLRHPLARDAPFRGADRSEFGAEDVETSVKGRAALYPNTLVRRYSSLWRTSHEREGPRLHDLWRHSEDRGGWGRADGAWHSARIRRPRL